MKTTKAIPQLEARFIDSPKNTERGHSMYGGNNKSFTEIAAEVKKTVIGQDATVDWLCTFVDAACEHSRLIEEEDFGTMSLPNLGSALLVGPTASGKSHLMKTFAKASGLLFHPIDAGQMTAEGWYGDSFSTHWVSINEDLEVHPKKNVLVFIDEVDKLLKQKRDGAAFFDLLKPLEGGVLEGNGTVGKSSVPYRLDLDRCIFVLAGAFTGIEELISKRFAKPTPTIGFGSSSVVCSSQKSIESLRQQITLDDIEAWGAPRELVGRIATTQFIAPLGQDALRSIVRENKQAEYAAMFHGADSFTIDQDAEDLIVENALAAAYGARSINQQLNALCFGPLWNLFEQKGKTGDITVTAANGKLIPVVLVDERKKAEREIAALKSEQEESVLEIPELEREIAECARATMPASTDVCALLDEVHQYIAANETSEYDSKAMLEDDFIATAATILNKSAAVTNNNGELEIDNDYSPAEIALLHSLTTLLKDWFRTSDCMYGSIEKLASLADGSESSEKLNELDRTHSALELMFMQIANGLSYCPVIEMGDEKFYDWVPSKFVRNGDGVKPAEQGGLSPSKDEALGYYQEFLNYPPASRALAVRRLKSRF